MDSVLVRVRQSAFLRHNAVFFVGSLGVAALNYLFYPVLGRMMDPADFGEVQTLISIFTQVTIFLGILTYVTIRVTVDTDNPAKRNQRLQALEQLAFIGGLVVAISSVLTTGFVRDFLQLSSGWPFVIMLVSLVISIPLLMRMAFLRGRKQYAKSALTDGIGSATKLILSPVFVLVGLKSFGALLGLAISQVVSLGVGVVWAYRAGLREFGIKRGQLPLRQLRPELRYAFTVFLVSGSIITITSLDILAIKHYFPPEQAGLYAGMATVARIVFFLTTPFTGVMLTLIGPKNPPEQNALWLKGSLALVLASGGAAVLFMSLVPDLTVNWLVGSKYGTYADLLPRLSAVMLLLGLANVLLMYQIALKRYAFGLFPVGGVILTLVLIISNHETIDQIVNGLLSGSIVVVLASFIHMIGRRTWAGSL